MNWNGQGKNLDHLIATRYDASRAPALQADFDAQRRARVQKALQTRPVFIPLQFEMNAAGQTSPYRQTTDSLSYDVIVTGVRSDSVIDDSTDGGRPGQNRDIVISRANDTRPLVAIEYDADVNLRVDEIAGKTAAVGAGQAGVFYLPAPIVVPAGEQLTVQMLKSDTTDDYEVANIVLIGLAVYSKEYVATMLDARELAKIDEAIARRSTPEVKFLKQTFDFDSAAFGGAARNLSTPTVDEPLLVRGLRTSLANSLIEIGLNGQPLWTVDPTPVWALAAEQELEAENYVWFSRPIFLRSGGTIDIPRITNGTGTSNLNGSLDAQLDNTITWICETI